LRIELVEQLLLREKYILEEEGSYVVEAE